MYESFEAKQPHGFKFANLSFNELQLKIDRVYNMWAWYVNFGLYFAVIKTSSRMCFNHVVPTHIQNCKN